MHGYVPVTTGKVTPSFQIGVTVVELAPIVVVVQVCGAGNASRERRLHPAVALDEAPACQSRARGLISSASNPAKAVMLQGITTGAFCCSSLGQSCWSPRSVEHLVSSRNLPFHSPHTSQLGKLPTWYRPPQSHGSASSFTCSRQDADWIVWTRLEVLRSPEPLSCRQGISVVEKVCLTRRASMGLRTMPHRENGFALPNSVLYKESFCTGACL